MHIIIDHLADFMGTSTECSKAATVTLKQHGYYRNNLDDTATMEKLFDGILAWNSYVVGDVK